jgi:hypothetical protein
MIWVAADSEQTGVDTFGNKKATRYQCKLTKEGAFYWGSSSDFYVDDVSGFSIQKLIHQTKGKTLHEIATNFASSAKEPILKEFLSVQNQMPPADTYPFASIIFLGVTDSKPEVFIVSFTIERHNNQLTVASNGPITPPENVGGGIGIRDEALAYMAAHCEQIALNAIGVLRNSMLAEEKKFPNDIGGKISIVQLSPKRH